MGTWSHGSWINAVAIFFPLFFMLLIGALLRFINWWRWGVRGISWESRPLRSIHA